MRSTRRTAVGLVRSTQREWYAEPRRVDIVGTAGSEPVDELRLQRDDVRDHAAALHATARGRRGHDPPRSPGSCFDVRGECLCSGAGGLLSPTPNSTPTGILSL